MSYFTKHRSGFIGSFIIHAIILAILILFGFFTPLPLPGEEGILVNFGTTDQGLGRIEPAPRRTPPPVVEEEPVKEVAAESASRDEKAKDGSPDLEEQEPVPTAMAVAFATRQEKDETGEDFVENQTTKRERSKHKEERDEIIARTLATKQ